MRPHVEGEVLGLADGYFVFRGRRHVHLRSIDRLDQVDRDLPGVYGNIDGRDRPCVNLGSPGILSPSVLAT